MILVDIYVPSVDKIYDFHLEESAKVKVVLDEIVEMISQIEHTTLFGNPADLSLCDRMARRSLPPEATLEACGIHTGSSMILI